MKKIEHIKTTQEFANVYKNAKKWHCDGVIVFYLNANELRFGVVASKKIGCAVIRNRAKRVLRAVFMDISDDIKNGIYLFIAKNGVEKIPYQTLKKNVKWTLKKLWQ